MVYFFKSQSYFFFFLVPKKALTFFNKGASGEIQSVTFDGDEIKKLFYGSFHKVFNLQKIFVKVVDKTNQLFL